MGRRVVNAGKPSLPQKAGVEFLGTFFVTLVATGVDVGYYSGGHVDYVSRWLARGFITIAMIYAFSDISGAHIDPAVSLGFAVRRAMPTAQMLWYWLSQFAGGFAAAALAMALWSRELALGASHPGPQYTQFEAFVAEIVLTFLLMIVILTCAEEESVIGKQAALAVGLTVAACGFFAGPISGASMNPARSIPPQLLGGLSGLSWIYAAGPCVGAALAGGAMQFLSVRPRQGERKAGSGE
ncbi:MAG: aquaporin [Candidatus Eremiobacteraeota bacterium]|nr:aquaporin [Candidatus Eremiobacteraeota bacterium]